MEMQQRHWVHWILSHGLVGQVTRNLVALGFRMEESQVRLRFVYEVTPSDVDLQALEEVLDGYFHEQALAVYDEWIVDPDPSLEEDEEWVFRRMRE